MAAVFAELAKRRGLSAAGRRSGAKMPRRFAEMTPKAVAECRRVSRS
jgi:hypothetical protein